MIQVFVFIVGAAIGSFLNVLIDRLPRDESINGRSHCDYCKKKIPGYDMVPILSYFILGGKTRCCKKKLSWQYPLIELVTGIAFILIFNFQFSIYNKFSIINFQLIALFGIVACSIVIFVSDLKYHLISDYIQIAIFVFSVFYHLPGNPNLFLPIFINLLTSAFIVALPIWLIYFFSKEKAMGLGDVYLALNLGFLLGWEAGLLALYIAFVVGAVYGLALILTKRKKLKSKVAFGPFIIIGTIIMLFWGDKIVGVVQKMYGF